ncbi:carbohydrate ABC transporter permease [Cohnella zeiphila]|uniref:Carbohydrate ABC transporter permease n=1 Tax=Cohnella zeiphila TaxID=2761120 RepID=A0A7X0VUU2_9BACL|nr:carbohydrate ABC transporter permease [Cohnella zeiphila]MBB6731334.1 carbohydrate ABC transporter permease [Cohnella zeiphila]
MHLISRPYRAFLIFNYVFLTFIALLSLFPILNVLSVSFSSSSAADSGQVVLWPVEFTWKSYDFVLQAGEFNTAFVNSVLRVVLGVPLSVLVTVLIAYPLSKENATFPQRTLYVWIFVFTMLFSGGLIPSFLVIKQLHLLDSVWALVLPVTVQVFNVLLMLNFFRNLPKELEDASLIDGASHWRTLWSVYLPISLPSLATILLFTLVMHWNSWFDGMIYMNDVGRYPLATYLQSILNMTSIPKTNLTLEQAILLKSVSSRTARAAQIFVAAFPILLIYPFLQKYFVKGLVVGSVKG